MGLGGFSRSEPAGCLARGRAVPKVQARGADSECAAVETNMPWEKLTEHADAEESECAVGRGAGHVLVSRSRWSRLAMAEGFGKVWEFGYSRTGGASGHIVPAARNV